jgi:hypothetical protein
LVNVTVGQSPNIIPAAPLYTRQIASSITTSDPRYFLQLRPKVTIQSNDGRTTYFIYDSFMVNRGSWTALCFSSLSYSFGNESYTYQSGSFDSLSFTLVSFSNVQDSSLYNNPSFQDPAGSSTANPNRIRVLQVVVDVALNAAGTFEVMIEDSQKLIDRTTVGLGSRFIIDVGKTPTSFQNIINGYCKRVETKRDDTGTLIYVFQGYDAQIIFNERIVDFQKQAARQSLGSNVASPIGNNTSAYQLVRSLLEGSGHMPIKGLPSIVAGSGLTENGLDPRVDTFIPAISQPLVEASAVMDTIANESGSIWGVQNGDIFLRYPTHVHTGVTIKDTMEEHDPINKTSYINGAWDFIDSIDQQDGFCNGLFLKGATISGTPDVHSLITGGSTSLYNKDVSQQIIPGAARLKNLALLLQKTGTGGSEHQQYVTGAIVHDLNGQPTGSKIMDIKIPVTSIDVTPTAVFDFNTKFAISDVQVNSPVWIILYAKGTSEDNTIRWINDGDTNTPNRYSGHRTVSLDPASENRVTPPLKNDSIGWIVSDSGPTYTHSFFQGVRTLSYVSDPQSQMKYGIVEAVQDVPWIQDNPTLQTYAGNVLSITAKPIRKFQMAQVTIPNDFIFLPGQQISIIDTLSGVTAPKALDAEIQEVRYTFTAPSSSTAQSSSAPGSGSGAHSLGSNYCEVVPVSYLDFLTSGL